MSVRVNIGSYKQAMEKLMEASRIMETLAVACLKDGASSDVSSLLYGIVDSMRGLHTEVNEVEQDFNEALKNKPVRSMVARRFQARPLKNLDTVSRRIISQTRRMSRIEQARQKEISRLKA